MAFLSKEVPIQDARENENKTPPGKKREKGKRESCHFQPLPLASKNLLLSFLFFFFRLPPFFPVSWDVEGKGGQQKRKEKDSSTFLLLLLLVCACILPTGVRGGGEEAVLTKTGASRGRVSQPS